MNYQDVIQDLLTMIRSEPVSRELEKDLLELNRALDFYFMERDYQALQPRDPDEPHPMEAELKRIFAPDSDSWGLHY